MTPELLRQFHAKGTMAKLTYNGEPGGFLAWRHHAGPTHIYYTAIEEPVRRILNASALVTLLALETLSRGNDRIRLWCASDLPANRFWADIGGEPVLHDQGKHKHKRPRTLYRIRASEFLRSRYAATLCPTNSSTLITCASLPSVALTLPATSDLSLCGLPSMASWLRTLAAPQTSPRPSLNCNNVAASRSRPAIGEDWHRRSKLTGIDSLLPSLSVRPDTTFGYNFHSTPRTRSYRRPADDAASA